MPVVGMIRWFLVVMLAVLAARVSSSLATWVLMRQPVVMRHQVLEPQLDIAYILTLLLAVAPLPLTPLPQDYRERSLVAIASRLMRPLERSLFRVPIPTQAGLRFLVEPLGQALPQPVLLAQLPMVLLVQL